MPGARRLCRAPRRPARPDRRSRRGGTRPGPSIAPASTPGPPTPSRAMQDDDTARLRHAATTEARLLLATRRGGRGAAGGPRGEGRRARRGGGAGAAAGEAAAAMAVRLGLPPSAPAKASASGATGSPRRCGRPGWCIPARASAEAEARSSRLRALREAWAMARTCRTIACHRSRNGRFDALRDRKAAAGGRRRADDRHPEAVGDNRGGSARGARGGAGGRSRRPLVRRP